MFCIIHSFRTIPISRTFSSSVQWLSYHIRSYRSFFESVTKMLGRKQSLRGETILADYGPDEAFNESTDIEWVNKVSYVNF